ncbi:MAG: hypothetical protein WC767_01135 [Candidatus Paceibacterota bacterium]|jgi:hypothetical protein
MRIEKVSYVVKAGKATYVMTMTRVAGMKVRELVPVRTKRARRQ